MFKLDLEKAEELGIKLLTSVGSQIKKGNFRKTSGSLIMLKLLLYGSQETVEKF